MSAVCIFCNKAAEKWSEGHAISDWLLDYFEISAQDQTFKGYAMSGGEVTTQRIFATRRLVEGRVCTPCNNGWMSDLETNVKTTLVPLTEHKRAL